MHAFVASPPLLPTKPIPFLRRPPLRSYRISIPSRNASPSMSTAATPPNPQLPLNSSTPTPTPTASPLPRNHLIWRCRVFLTMLISYAIYYLTRFSFPFSAPIMQTSINLSLQQIGLINSCFPLAYGISKLFGGLVADLGSQRLILSAGLALAALCNILFTAASSVPYFAFIWALNGLVSSVGFPACAKLLSNWFSATERGTYWGILNVSLNIGGALSPIIIGTAAAKLGWRFGMLIPAVMALAMSAVAYVAIADSPKQAGLTPFEPEEAPKKRGPEAGGFQATIAVFRTHLVEGVLHERAVWLLAGAYFFVYMIRQALTSWTVFYLMQARGVSTLVEAGLRVSGLELGGLLGSLSSGWLSDRLVARNREAGAIGQRVRVIMIYLVITAAAVTGFFYVPVTKALLPVQWGLFAMAGFGLYGPQLLVGLSGTECVDRRYAGTSNGFVGLVAYGGSALAGFPLALCVKKLGWNSLFVMMVGCCVAVSVLLVPLLGKKSYEQMSAERRSR